MAVLVVLVVLPQLLDLHFERDTAADSDFGEVVIISESQGESDVTETERTESKNKFFLFTISVDESEKQV